jgi:hypothetical protein
MRNPQIQGGEPMNDICGMKKKLPPGPEGMNEERAEWAGAALRHFQWITGTDYEDALGDLLGDLMHWSDRNNFDFEAALYRARAHYQAETAKKGPAKVTPQLLAALKALHRQATFSDIAFSAANVHAAHVIAEAEKCA